MPQFIAEYLVAALADIGVAAEAGDLGIQIAAYGITSGLTYGVGAALTPSPKGLAPQTQQQAFKQAVAPRRKYYALLGRMSVTG